MELVVKLPKGKLPFIGVVFSNVWSAERENKHCIENEWTDTFKLRLIPKERSIDVHFIHHGQSTYVYKDLIYSPEKLVKFIYASRGASLFNFSHLICENNKHLVVKSATNRRLWVLKMDEIIVEAPEW